MRARALACLMLTGVADAAAAQETNPHPSVAAVRLADGERIAVDGRLASDDRFMWALDPHFDQRSGYFFEIKIVLTRRF